MCLIGIDRILVLGGISCVDRRNIHASSSFRVVLTYISGKYMQGMSKTKNKENRKQFYRLITLKHGNYLFKQIVEVCYILPTKIKNFYVYLASAFVFQFCSNWRLNPITCLNQLTVDLSQDLFKCNLYVSKQSKTLKINRLFRNFVQVCERYFYLSILIIYMDAI